MRLLLLLPFIMIGCAPKVEVDHEGSISGIDPAFNACYQKFGQQYGMNVTMPIGFRPQAGMVVGACIEYDDSYRDIEIDPDYWASIDADTQCVLVNHELGHCVFNRLHNWDILPDGCPFSIMQYTNFGDPCYALHHADYMAELPHSEPGDHL